MTDIRWMGLAAAGVLVSLLGLGLSAMVVGEPPTQMQERFAGVCDTIIKVSVGAIVGLLGGRTAAADRMELSDK